jgi:hypothetical protein
MSGALNGIRVIAISASISLDRWRHCGWPIRAPRSSASTHWVGPRWRHPANAVLQRGKRSIVLDLKGSNEAALAITVFGRGEEIGRRAPQWAALQRRQQRDGARRLENSSQAP